MIAKIAQTLRDLTAVDLAHIRADRARAQALRETLRYHRDGLYRQRLEDFDAVLARRERKLEVRT